ncbi:MAG TPA: hypothetical protein V6D19_06565 [Stenomitos sp.]
MTPGQKALWELIRIREEELRHETLFSPSAQDELPLPEDADTKGRTDVDQTG